MSNYTRKSNYWLKKRRMANDRQFARKRPIEKARIVNYYLRSLFRWIMALALIFFVLGVYFRELFFIYIGIIPVVIGSLIWTYRIRRQRRYLRYYNIASLQKMNPLFFEEYILALYNRMGYHLTGTPPSGDAGADGIGKDIQWNKMIIQIKRYADTSTIGSPDIRDFVGSMAYYGVKYGIFLTTGYFTKSAIDMLTELSSDMRIQLIDKDGLLRLLEKTYPKK